MTRQAFLAQMPVPRPPFAPHSVSPVSSPGNLFSLSFSLYRIRFPLSLPWLWPSLSTLSPEVSRDRVGWSLYSFTDSPVPYSWRDLHTFYRVFGALTMPTTRTTTTGKPKANLYDLIRSFASARLRTGKCVCVGEVVRRNRWCVRVFREPEKERGSEAVSCLALLSICSSQVARTLDIETLR